MNIIFKKIVKIIIFFVITFCAVYIVLNFQALFLKLNYWLRNESYILENDTSEVTPLFLSGSNLQENRLLIPKINVNVPIIFSDDNSEDKILENLKNGVVHYSNTALPGEKGNCFITGHSSDYFWNDGNYKTVFALLNELLEGDEIYIIYEGKRYTYKVTERTIVGLNNTDVVNPTEKSTISLMTCWPIGTSFWRLVVKGELAENF